MVTGRLNSLYLQLQGYLWNCNSRQFPLSHGFCCGYTFLSILLNEGAYENRFRVSCLHRAPGSTDGGHGDNRYRTAPGGPGGGAGRNAPDAFPGESANGGGC